MVRPEAGAGGLGREVRLEDPRQRRRRPCRRRCRRRRCATPPGRTGRACTPQAPVARHRVQRVLDHVGERARQQHAVDHDGGRSPPATSMRRCAMRPASAVRVGLRGSRRAAAPAASAPGALRGERGEARELRGELAQQPHLQQDVVDAVVDAPAPSGRPRSACTRRRCSAFSWIGVSGFLMSCATCRAISAHASRRLVRSSCAALALQVVGHAVEGLDQAAEFVGRASTSTRASRSPAGDAPRGAGQPAHRIRDALGHPVADGRRRAG